MQLDLQLLNMIKGFCIGLCSSAPIGPIAVYVIQQSLSKGHKAGFITGLGATIVDTVFACISIFALAYAQEFMDRHSEFLLVAGGITVTIIGVIMIFTNPIEREARLSKGNERITKLASKNNRVTVNDFIKSLLMGLQTLAAYSCSLLFSQHLESTRQTAKTGRLHLQSSQSQQEPSSTGSSSAGESAISGNM